MPKMKKLRIGIIVTGILTGILAIIGLTAGIVEVISIVQSATAQPLVRLENGGEVHIEESRTYSIFLEDTAPPTLNSHDFTFIHIETQNRVYSYVPHFTSTYSVGAVMINGEPVRGRFGRLVALVDLETGGYIIEYPPLDGLGDFVWGGLDITDNLLAWGFRMLILMLALITLSVVFFILLFKYNGLKKLGKKEYAAR